MKRFSLSAATATVTLAMSFLACGGGEQPASDLSDIIPADARLVKVSMDVEFDTAGSPLWDDG